MDERMRWRDCRGAAAFSTYLILSFLFFGRGLIGHLSDRYIGIGTDPGLFIFFLEWWKYVFTHHVNPFITHLQWAPEGANLAWATFIPLFGVAAVPLTATLGPVATFNLLVLLCPALAAWTAFLLCRYVSGSFRAALMGGYVFGFSSYMLAHLLGHLTVLMLFPVPLMVLVTLRRLNAEIGAWRFAMTLGVLVVALFLCWPEAVATATLFGGIAAAIAWWSAPELRARLQQLIVPAAAAYLASAIILSPYLYYFFAFGQPLFPGGMRSIVSVNPLNFVIPSRASLFGTFAPFPPLLTGHIYEAGAYIALPLLLIVIAYARTHWSEWRVRLLGNMLAVVCVASLGSSLRIGGGRPIPMPWAIAAHLPLMDKALPARFSIYGFLAIAIIISLWLSDEAVGRKLRAAGACAMVLFTLPNPSSAFWTTPLETPAFFTSGEYKDYIAPGDNVLILPYGEVGNSNIWQATTGLYFRLAGGYLGQPPIPNAYLPYFPIVYDLYNLADSPLSGEMLKVFLAQKEIRGIVVADQGAPVWRNSRKPGLQFPEATALDEDERAVIDTLLGTLGVKPVRVGGVAYYRVPLEELAAYRETDPGPLQAQSAAIQLDALINAAAKYVAEGHPLSELNPVEAQRLGLLPPHWIGGVSPVDPRAPMHNGLVITSTNKGNVLVGLIGTPETLSGLAEKYRPYAKRVEMSSLINIAGWAESSRSILLLEYDSRNLAETGERGPR